MERGTNCTLFLLLTNIYDYEQTRVQGLFPHDGKDAESIAQPCTHETGGLHPYLTDLQSHCIHSGQEHQQDTSYLYMGGRGKA